MFTKTTFSLVAFTTLISTLQASDTVLDPIVISATQTEQSLKDITSNVDVITASQLEEKHITSVIDALRSLGNIPIAQSGGIGQQSSFFQRGFSSANTVVMIDGIRYNDPTTTQGQAQLEHLMVNDIERIEVIHGAQSGIWGANAVAGVINIITKKATKQFQASTILEYGTYATSKLGANVSQKVGDLSYYVGANQLKSDGISTLTPRGQNPKNYESDGYRNQTVNAKISYDLTSADTLSGQMNFVDAKSHYDGYDAFTFAPLPNSVANEIHQLNRLGSVGYRHTFTSTDFIDASYGHSTFDKKDPLGFTTAFMGTNKEANLLGRFSYISNGFIIVGGNTLESHDTIGDHTLRSKGVFATNTNHLGNLILTQSLRNDSYDTFKDKTTGKMGAKYLFANDIALSGNYGTAYRTPALAEMYGFGGNTLLQPETTKSFDATLRYRSFTFSYYDNVVTNLIQYVFDPNTFIGSNQQVEGKSHLKGYEARYQHTFFDTFRVNLAYNRLIAKDKDGKDLARRPHDTASGALGYYPIDKLSLLGTLNYIGTRYDDPARTLQTGRYVLTGAVINYEATPKLSLYLRGDNLTDRRYQEVNGYGAYGRTLMVGLNARF